MEIKVSYKVKTKLQLRACPLVCEMKGEDYDYYDAFHKRWDVVEELKDGFVLKDKKGDTMLIDKNGNGLVNWKGHKVYKVIKK